MNAPVVEKDSQAGTESKVERFPVAHRQSIVMESAVPVLDTGMFEHMQRIAKTMASSSLVPEHLNVARKVAGQLVAIEEKEAVANCFLVVNQSIRWRMDPFAVAQHTFVHKGKIGYEGKLVAAVINTHPALTQRLSYKYEGTGEKRKVIVSGRTSSDPEVRTIEGTVEQWKTSNENWTKSPDQMLSYRGAREWARRWMPEAILGVWSDDEVADFAATDRVQVTAEQPRRGAAGLKDALGAGGAKPDVSDAEVITGTAATAPGGEPVEVTKVFGTVEQRDAIIAKLKGCSDLEVLDLVRDEANATEWTKPDLGLIDDVYRACKEELTAKKA